MIGEGNEAHECAQEHTGNMMRTEELLGRPANEIPTPALLVDLDVFEANVRTMADHCRSRGILHRPHGKHFKSPAIAKELVAAGAVGVCGAKLGEGEVFVKGGIRDVLITAPVVGTHKIRTLVELVGITPDIKVVVDNHQNVRDLAAAARSAGRRLKVLVEINVGQDRTGVDTPEEAVALARVIAAEEGLELKGVQAYAGHNQAIHGFENRRAATIAANERGARSWVAIREAGFPVSIVSVGGTGSAFIDSEFEGVTEVQPGSYIFMDTSYAAIGGEHSDRLEDFQYALTVLTTVISRPTAGRAVTDGGNKALTTDSGLASLKDLPGVTYRPAGDEYGLLLLRQPSRGLKVGQRVEFIPSHSDTNVNLYDCFFGVRNGTVETVWPIAARGRSD